LADWDERYRRGEHAGLEPDPLLEFALACFRQLRPAAGDAEYPAGTAPLVADEAPPLAGAAPRPPDLDQFAPRALDLACGAGRHALRLAEAGFAVTAVDSSPAAIGLARERARARGLAVEARVADLESGEFSIEPEAFDLICDFFYLQRDLFAAIRAGLRPGGLFVAAIHTADDDPRLRPMNPAFLLRPGELREEFAGWHLVHYDEAKEFDGAAGAWRRRTARLVARRPL